MLLPTCIFSVGLRGEDIYSFTYFLQTHLNPDVAEKSILTWNMGVFVLSSALGHNFKNIKSESVILKFISQMLDEMSVL